MPITASVLTNGTHAGNVSSVNTASITPGANRLVLAYVSSRDMTAPVNFPTLSGNGLTWVQIDADEVTGSAGHSLFRAMGGSPSTGAVTIDFGATQAGICWSIIEFDGVDTSGTNGSGAIVQQVQNGGFGTAVSVALASFGSSDNRPYAAFAISGVTTTFTPETGYTELADQSQGGFDGDPHSQAVEWHDTTAETSPTGTFATGGDWGGYGVEIKVAAAAAVAALGRRVGQLAMTGAGL